MLTLFVRNSRIIQSAGVSFAVLGTTMHLLNVANLVSPALSHTWSAIAVVGFCLTAIMARMLLIKRRKATTGSVRAVNVRNDVALP
jgi:hypothetical protein